MKEKEGNEKIFKDEDKKEGKISKERKKSRKKKKVKRRKLKE